MTTKTITGTYSAGYLLNGAVNTVSISSTGSVGGFGLVTNAFASVVNAGRLDAADGADGLSFGAGGGDLTNSWAPQSRGRRAQRHRHGPCRRLCRRRGDFHVSIRNDSWQSR